MPVKSAQITGLCRPYRPEPWEMPPIRLARGTHTCRYRTGFDRGGPNGGEPQRLPRQDGDMPENDEEWPELTCPSCGLLFLHPGGNVVVCDKCGAQVRPRRPGAKPFLLDSNAYDPLVDDPKAWRLAVEACRAGRIELLMTHVQWDELCEIGDAERRAMAASIPFVIVATYGMILGPSKVGLARIGEPEKVEAVRNYSDNHSHDALLAATAEKEGAILVTNDGRLTKFARRAGIEVWSSATFAAFLQS